MSGWRRDSSRPVPSPCSSGRAQSASALIRTIRTSPWPGSRRIPTTGRFTVSTTTCIGPRSLTSRRSFRPTTRASFYGFEFEDPDDPRSLIAADGSRRAVGSKQGLLQVRSSHGGEDYLTNADPLALRREDDAGDILVRARTDKKTRGPDLGLVQGANEPAPLWREPGSISALLGDGEFHTYVINGAQCAAPWPRGRGATLARLFVMPDHNLRQRGRDRLHPLPVEALGAIFVARNGVDYATVGGEMRQGRSICCPTKPSTGQVEVPEDVTRSWSLGAGGRCWTIARSPSSVRS